DISRTKLSILSEHSQNRPPKQTSIQNSRIPATILFPGLGQASPCPPWLLPSSPPHAPIGPLTLIAPGTWPILVVVAPTSLLDCIASGKEVIGPFHIIHPEERGDCLQSKRGIL